MNYPVAYAVIPEEEMIYISGGKEPNYKGLFDYFIGDYLRDVVKGDVRDAVWNSAKQSSFTPITNWFKTVDDMASLVIWAISMASTICGRLSRVTWAKLNLRICKRNKFFSSCFWLWARSWLP